MSILTGPEILREIEAGNIVIDPMPRPEAFGPNSVNVRLGPTLLILDDLTLDITKKPTYATEHIISERGYKLLYGIGYLGHTLETIYSPKYVPWIDGRSTVGRYFLQVHQTAGRADVGWNGQLTLELMAMHRPVVVYTGVEIAQLTFFTTVGELQQYNGRYQGSIGPRVPKPLSIS